MIVKDEDAIRRLSSPMNLINRLAATKGSSKNSAMSLFGIGKREKVDIQTEDRINNKIDKQVESVRVSFNPFQSSNSQSSQVPELIRETSSPILDNILKDNESQIKLGLAHDRALDLLNLSTEMLLAKLDDVSASKLPAVISAASKTVEGIRRERNESAKNNKDREVHYHFYTPEQKKLDSYEIIDVTT